MEREQFTYAEARALIGKTFVSIVEFSGVPKGTRGRVVTIDQMGGGWDVVIEWELQRSKPLRDWFTKDELARFMQEV